MTADLSLIWRQGAWLPRFALLVAAGAAAAHLASLAGAGWQDLEPFGIGLHLAVMGLILAVVLRGWRDLFARSRSGDHKLVPFPRGLTRVCVGLVAYALVWFVALFATYGEGWYEVRDGQYL